MKESRSASIYKIVNRATNDTYVGSTILDPPTRWSRHYRLLVRGENSGCRLLQKAWNVSKITDWDFSVLETDIYPEEKLDREQFWVDELKPSLNSIKPNIFKIKKELDYKIFELLNKRIKYRDIGRQLGCSIGKITNVKRRYFDNAEPELIVL